MFKNARNMCEIGQCIWQKWPIVGFMYSFSDWHSSWNIY